METAVKFVGYMNGCIRTPEGKLVAHYDASTGVLHVDGHVDEFRAGDIEDAMDLINLVWVG